MENPVHQKIQGIVNAHFDSTYSWSVVNKALSDLALSSSWKRSNYGSSVIVSNRRRRVTVKVSLGREVIVDLEIKPFEFKSEYHRCETIEDAAQRFTEIVRSYN